jgi:hypothetical protein
MIGTFNAWAKIYNPMVNDKFKDMVVSPIGINKGLFSTFYF